MGNVQAFCPYLHEKLDIHDLLVYAVAPDVA